MASELTQQEAIALAQEREYVESKWKNVVAKEKWYSPEGKHYVEKVIVIFASEFAIGTSWHAAFVFTQEREEQIAQLERNINWIANVGFYLPTEDAAMAIRRSILALLQRELAQAKQGWKERP